MPLIKRDPQMTAMAGEFLTAGKLFKMGYQVSITFGNAKTIDLFVFNPSTNRTFNVQVKTQRQKNCFPMKKDNIVRDHIYVFCRLNEVDKNEEFFIVPGNDLLEDINKFFGASYIRPEGPSSMPAVNYGPLKPYSDNWAVFDQRYFANDG